MPRVAIRRTMPLSVESIAKEPHVHPYQVEMIVTQRRAAREAEADRHRLAKRARRMAGDEQGSARSLWRRSDRGSGWSLRRPTRHQPVGRGAPSMSQGG